jgi:hypothetical protein
MSVQLSKESDILNNEQYKENFRNISKLYITKKFNSAYELCEECVKEFKVENLLNIFDKIKKDDDDDDEYILHNKKKEEKEDLEEIKRSVIPSDLLQIYLKIIEQIKPEINCWDILNKYYKDVSEIPSKILTSCALIEVKKQNLEISKKNLRKWIREMSKEEKEKLREKQQPNFRFYEMLIEIYVLHVLAPLEEYNSSIDFLEGEDYLTMDRKKLICDKVVKMETLKEQEKQKDKNAKTSSNKNLFSSINEISSSKTSVDDTLNDIKDNNKEIIKRTKSKQKKINNKHQNKYDIGNGVVDGSYESFWKILSRFLMDKAPFILVIILFIAIKKNPEIIRGTIFERILKKLHETIMIIIKK